MEVAADFLFSRFDCIIELKSFQLYRFLYLLKVGLVNGLTENISYLVNKKDNLSYFKFIKCVSQLEDQELRQGSYMKMII